MIALACTEFAAVDIDRGLSALLPVAWYDFARRYIEQLSARALIEQRDYDDLDVAGLDDDAAREQLTDRGWVYLGVDCGFEIWGHR
jgi:hypothetical protein